jgi:spore germination protein KA
MYKNLRYRETTYKRGLGVVSILNWFSKNKPISNDNSKSSLLEYAKDKLSLCSDVNLNHIEITKDQSCTLIYINTITDGKLLKNFILNPLLKEIQKDKDVKSLVTKVKNRVIFPLQLNIQNDRDKIILDVLDGHAALFFEQIDFVFLFPIKNYQKRSIAEPQNETVVIGPQESLIEDLDSNLSLLRHRLKHPNFKIKQYQVGEFTRTNVCLLYITDFANPHLLNIIEKKLKQIKIQGVLGVSYLSEFLESTPSSIFPQVLYTERPDTIVGSLLEGKISILVDGSPVSIIAPITFATLLQSAEDYHQRYVVATWIRWIRYFFVIASFLLPSFYVAITTFHPEMLPTDLLITITAARELIPFPTLVEAIMMEMTFEGLREAGTRIPKPIGQTISIIGAIVIGQTAVQAGIVSSPVVIVVSITGIASYIIPHFELGLSFRLLRFPMLILGGTLGLFGAFIGGLLILYHLVNLTSFDVPYMKPIGPFEWKGIRDVFIRLSWRKRN